MSSSQKLFDLIKNPDFSCGGLFGKRESWQRHRERNFCIALQYFPQRQNFQRNNLSCSRPFLLFSGENLVTVNKLIRRLSIVIH